MSTTITHLVFVYGTLKEGFYNNRCLKDSKKIGNANTIAKYGMKHLGSFPGVDMTVEISQIFGEVWEVSEDVLKESLDMLEGYPSFYDRVPESVEVEVEGCDIGFALMQPWMYFLASPKDYSKEYILDGVWKDGTYNPSSFISNPESRIKSFTH